MGDRAAMEVLLRATTSSAASTCVARCSFASSSSTRWRTPTSPPSSTSRTSPPRAEAAISAWRPSRRLALPRARQDVPGADRRGARGRRDPRAALELHVRLGGEEDLVWYARSTTGPAARRSTRRAAPRRRTTRRSAGSARRRARRPPEEKKAIVWPTISSRPSRSARSCRRWRTSLRPWSATSATAAPRRSRARRSRSSRGAAASALSTSRTRSSRAPTSGARTAPWPRRSSSRTWRRRPS